MSSLSEFVDRTATLPSSYAVAIAKLMVEIERSGPLPATSTDRAILAGVSHARWITMEPIAARYFDHDDDGTWHIYELEEEREKRLTAREKMSEGGKRGVAIRAAEKARRERDEELAARREAREETREVEAGELPSGFADGLASAKGSVRVGPGYPKPTLTEPFAALGFDPLGSGVAPCGLTDCSVEENISSEHRSVSPLPERGSKDEETAGAGAARADDRVGLGHEPIR